MGAELVRVWQLHSAVSAPSVIGDYRQSSVISDGFSVAYPPSPHVLPATAVPEDAADGEQINDQQFDADVEPVAKRES